uniref:Disulfide isomerase/thiol-disulfide oxidase n=1 Tax=uncultured bacterium IN-11 TaxID=1805589 RepID=A0A142BW90_9BACT|nr:disulfide isomerase/thiol-disulfide oxidase [uncultured bacterium IN-11]
MKKTLFMLALATGAVSPAFADNCQEVASADQIMTLVKKVLPKSAISTMKTVDSGTTSCLVEVEMLVDISNTDSKGVIYVLPNGEQFISGVLMDADSKLILDSESEVSTGQGKKDENTPNANVLDSVGKPTVLSSDQRKHMEQFEVQPMNFTEIINKQFSAPTHNEGRKAVMEQMKKFVHVSNPKKTFNNDRNVYIMYDSDCPYCSKLFEQSDSLADKYQATFHWVPMFLTDQTFLKAALVTHATRQSQEKGYDMLTRIMTKAETDAALINLGRKELKPDDFDDSRSATTYYASVNMMAIPDLGTPWITVQNGDSYDMYQGLPNPEDWESAFSTEK